MKNFTIRSRLLFTMGSLAVLLFALGSTALYGLKKNKETFRAVYDNRLVALGQLDHVIRSILRTQIELSAATHVPARQIPAHLKNIEDNIALADAQWRAYIGTAMTAEEEVLLKHFEHVHQVFHHEVVVPTVALLKAGDQKSAQANFSEVLGLFQEVRTTMDKLIKIQLDIGESDYAHAQRSYEKFKIFAMLLVLCGLLLAVGMALWLMRLIFKPLRKAVHISSAISGGDLTQQIEVTSSNETGKLLSSLKEMNSSLQEIVGRVRSSIDTIASVTDKITTGNQDLSARTWQQARALEQAVTVVEALTLTLRQNSDYARQANQFALCASEVASKGGEVMAQVVQTMTSINAAAEKIVSIIAVIDSLAFQTNILALNAAIEAAHVSGQRGGFAVVAEEVRNLAQRSAQAAREIKALIHDSVEKIDAGSVLVDRAGATMDDIVVSVNRVTGIMADIAAAGDEQEAGIEQIHRAISEIDEVTHKNTTLAEDAVVAAMSLQDQANGLTQVVSIFKLARENLPEVAHYQADDILGEPRRNSSLQADGAGAVEVFINDQASKNR